MNPPASFWWLLLARLALEAGALVALTALLSARLASGAWRRTAWQTCLLGLLALLVGEVCGAGNFFGRRPLPAASASSNWRVMLQTFPSRSSTFPQTRPVERSEPTPASLPSASLPTDVGWWPGIVWLLGSSLFLARQIMARALFSSRRHRRHLALDDDLHRRLDVLARRLGCRQPVGATEAAGLSGPIVYGVFRPRLCLPQGLAAEFSGPQLDAMLAHELAHVGARDPGWYLLAELLVAAWWWHPAVWWMRRQLQTASEQAADEASRVVVDGPGALAECLVTIGRRLIEGDPASELGVNGRGYRSELGRRVTRLLMDGGQEWRPQPRWLSWCARFMGAACATLMLLTLGATAARDAEDSPLALRVWEKTAVAPAQKLPFSLGEPRLFAQANPKDLGPARATEAKRATTDAALRANSPADDGRRRALLAKLEQIRLPELILADLTLTEATRKLGLLVRESDPEKVGINLLVTDAVGPVRINLPNGLRDINVGQALDAIVKVSAEPLTYTVETYGVIFASRAAAPSLHTRWWHVDSNTLARALPQLVIATTNAEKGIRKTMQFPEGGFFPQLTEYFRAAGVDLSPPKAIFFSSAIGRPGMDRLMVRASLEELDLVENIVQVLMTQPPQLSIDVKYAEVEEDEKGGRELLDLVGLRPDVIPATPAMTLHPGSNGSDASAAASHSSTNSWTSILTMDQYRQVRRALEKRKGVDLLASPRLTTLSGRPAQIKIVDVRSIVTDLDLSDPSTVQPITTLMEFGPVLDVVPSVLVDGYTIDLTIISKVKEFLGYDLDSSQVFSALSGTNRTPTPLPVIRQRSAVASARVWDGQTVVVAQGVVESEGKLAASGAGPRKTTRKNLLIFVTPTLIDSAGNRLHADGDLPPRQRSVPTQK